MANVNLLQTNKWTDKQTSQKLYAPDLSMRGHKNKKLLIHI